jgi:hypothetical protein
MSMDAHGHVAWRMRFGPFRFFFFFSIILLSRDARRDQGTTSKAGFV